MHDNKGSNPKEPDANDATRIPIRMREDVCDVMSNIALQRSTSEGFDLMHSGAGSTT